MLALHRRWTRFAPVSALTAAALLLVAWPAASAQQSGLPIVPPAVAAPGAPDTEEPEFPPFDTVVKGFDKVVSTASGQSLYTLWKRQKDGQVFAELPKDFESQLLFVAFSFTGGQSSYSGVQWGDLYVQWRRYDKTLALVAPNFARRTEAAESKSAVADAFRGRVLLSAPIVAMGSGGGPVIDLDGVFVGGAPVFFQGYVRAVNPALARLVKAKAFPQNIEAAWEVPLADGTLTTLHYSLSVLPENNGYKPRAADTRVGYFHSAWMDLTTPTDDEPFKRFVNRWRVEKADPNLKLSPAKQPIVFYIEHTTPVRYRRYVREGIEMWNEAFEAIGILNAVEARQQDAGTGAYMDLDPEDVRYNFVRWNTNAAGYAIGPSRVDPRTGQILDADVVMNDGLLRWFAADWRNLAANQFTSELAPDTLAWLEQRPQWDPRRRLMSDGERAAMAARQPAFLRDPHAGPASLRGGMCALGAHTAHSMGMARLVEAAKDDDAPAGDLLDGVSEEAVGGMLRYVTAHEVGHTIGLRHNFIGSTVHSIADVNSPDFGDQAVAGSVMEYLAPNINFNDGPVDGPWTMTRLGKYDLWAIAYGYSTDEDLTPILAKVAEPGHQFATDEDSWGPDPRVRTWDFGADSLAWADSRMRLIKDLRTKILDKFVKDGQSWSRARDAYGALLGEQIGALVTAAGWVGGAYINRDHKGDPAGRAPITAVEPEKQRRALEFVIANTFRDDAFGLTPELLERMTIDKWWDEGGMWTVFDDSTMPVHDLVLSVQSGILTTLMNPDTLRRIYDNELLTPAGKDALTLPETLGDISDSIWTELGSAAGRRFSAREPLISGTRRNLQREHLERLVDLGLKDGLPGATGAAIASLANQNLRDLKTKIDSTLSAGKSLDPYTIAHLNEAKVRIESALDAAYIYNASDLRPRSSFFFPIGQQEQPAR